MPYPFISISCYKFATLSQLKPLREKLLSESLSLNLKGTILLSSEGINLFVSGAPENVHRLVDEIKKVPGLESLTPKVSECTHQPFTRMLVRIKKEIISFGVKDINPANYTSPYVAPKQLKQWLDEGRDLVLLDTRNHYEIKLGTFTQAKSLGIQHFREFPDAVASLPAELKEKTIVTFCTGGIRCEKAAPFLEAKGFKNVLQLEGGILKYFEECGGTHYQGDCFVFDHRVGLDPTLHESDYSLCYACLSPLTPLELADSRYVKGKSCPYCFEKKYEEMKARCKIRTEKFLDFNHHLPGSTPYPNVKPVKVSNAFAGLSLLEFLSRALPHVSLREWESLIEQGKVADEKGQQAQASRKVVSGERFYHLVGILSEPPVNAQVSVEYEDEAVCIIDKPAPLPVHPCGRYARNTLQYLLNQVYAPQKPRPCHRLDANTTGLMIIARTKHFAGLIQPQFTEGSVEKRYLARVVGHPPSETFSCTLPVSESTYAVGARKTDTQGKKAETLFKVIERYSDGTSLIEVRPLTGRTNQIRVHLWELGYPIVGDPLYLPGHKLGDRQTRSLADGPLYLHAEFLVFTHPVTRKRLEFKKEPPDYFHKALSF